MPRKTDGILFELQPRPTKGDDGKPLLYAQPVVEHKYDIDAIDDFCAKYRHTSKGEIRHLFDLFSEVATMWLRQGNRVETPFGSLAPKLKLLGEHTDPDKVTGRDVMYAGIEFIPSKQFVKDADCSADGFRLKKSKVGNSQIETQSTMEYLRHKLVGQLHLPLCSHLSMDAKYRLQKRAGSYTTNGGQVQPYHTYDVVDTRLSWTAETYTLYAEANNLFGSHCVDFGNIRQPVVWVTLGAKYRF